MLVDTSGLLCLLHAAEPQSADAVLFFDSAQSRHTTNYVLAEFLALAHARGLPRQPTLAFISDLQDSPEITVIYVHEALHRAALTLLQQRLDKSWSLCDAVSIELMRQYGIVEALTTDHHFEQAGFVRLLTP
ncbi:MAG: PIN domain-containing protein [Caldilineaceae bacterium]|nr:PIN domain-containing protein [Caldilineaceae bacterium]HRJ42292.1 PIN domain-containing protein [Caldilineaceae bacterium]